MNKQGFQLIQMMLDPRITAKPLWALATLHSKGIRRIPDEVYDDLRKRGSKGHALRFIRQWLDGEMLTRHNGQWILNSFLPPFPGSAYDRMFENLFSGRHLSPVSAFLAITAQCPCKCFHCSAQQQNGKELSSEEWIHTLQQLRQIGTSLIGFTGGEPLERSGLTVLVTEARRLGMSSILFTSGAGVAEEKFRQLKEAGLWACCVSLDFDTAPEHDQMRGKPGVFNQALEALKLSKKNGFYTMVSSVASRPFVETEMFRCIYALCRKTGVHEYRIVEPMPCGALAGASDEMLLTPKHIQILRDFHVQTNHAQTPPKVCAFNQIESPEIFGCGAGTQHLYIQPDGTVCPCDFTPLGFGNVKETPLSDIWKRMNLAMGDNPRSECFIQKHHALIHRHKEKGFPLPPETSDQVCREAGSSPLPGYFAMVTAQQRNKETPI